MLPPSDSLKHQSHKLAEVLASLQRQSSLPTPPPPYALNTNTSSNNPLPTTELDEDDMDDDINLAPIVIKIDTSITIDGQANTVAIPSSTSASSSAQSPTTDTTTPTSSSSRTILQQLQQQRQTKSAQLASTIIGALKSSGALDDLETGRQRPIEIEVNAGIHVKGNSNVVCADSRRKGAPPSPASPAKDNQPSRKRRAQSEPLEVPSLKKIRPST